MFRISEQQSSGSDARLMKGWYSQEPYLPFDMRQPNPVGGAFLIHGFLGTPADMRSIGEVLGGRGFDSVGPLIPGMGREIDLLGKMTGRIWRDRIEKEWNAFAGRYERRILVGYSLGGSLAMRIAARSPFPPDLVILLAPFVRIADWRAIFLPIAKYFMQDMNFFANVDIRNPETRAWFAKAMPGLDLDDPQVSHGLKHEAGVSARVIDELRRVGVSARYAAAMMRVPTVILQGLQDAVVLPRFTRRLAGSIPGLIDYHEFPGDHMIPFSAFDSWQVVEPFIHQAIDSIMPSGDVPASTGALATADAGS